MLLKLADDAGWPLASFFFVLNPFKFEFMFILWHGIMFLYDILKITSFRTIFK